MLTIPARRTDSNRLLRLAAHLALPPGKPLYQPLSLFAAEAAPLTVPSSAKPAKQWAPRVWEGADYFSWLRLLVQNRFAVQPPFWYIAAIASCVTFGQTVLRWLQHALHGDAVARTRLAGPPLFVLGHWRTGTTLLHELLILDERFTSPTTLQCFVPCNFLLTEDVMKRYGNIFLPDKRPMDNMAAGWDRPQEDEFALALLGAPSPYFDFAFPHRPPLFPGSLDLSGLTASQRRKWKTTFVRFLKAVTYRDPRRLVLKSPPHTARLPVLLELFPDAKFVHIRRDPYTLFASTLKLWKAMAEKHGLQRPDTSAAAEEKVFADFELIHRRYEEGKRLIPAGHLVEVRYEELIADMPGVVKGVYDGLNLSGFEAVRPKLEAYVAGARNYEANRHSLTAEQKARIAARWGDIIRSQGYSV